MSNPLEDILLDEAGADPRPESDRGEGARRDGRMRLLPEPVRRLLQRKAVKNAGILTGGTMLAQVVTLASTPLLSRLYGPEQFGLLGLLMNIATMGGSVGALCYEMAILQPRSERTARALFALSIQLSFAASLIVMAIIWALDAWRHGVFGRPLDLWFYVFCYVGVLTSVQLNALSLAQSRRDLFRPMAISKINQTLLPTVFQIGFGFLKNVDLGLMAGRTIGLIGTNLVMQRAQPAGYRMRDAFRARPHDLWAVAKRYKDYMFHVPRQLLMRGATTAPPILLIASYGPVAGGLFFFAQRIVERPGMLLADTLTRLPMQQFSNLVAKRKPLTRSALLYSAACGAPVIAGCLLLALIARPVVPVLFGHRWAPAADYAVVLGFWAAIRLSTLPMATLVAVLRIQRSSLVIDIVFFARLLVIPWMAHRGYTAIQAVAVFCVLSVAYHLAIFALGLYASLRYDRTLKTQAS